MGGQAPSVEPPQPVHPGHYWSTACQHELHERCRLTCKFCSDDCVCDCHTEALYDALTNPVSNPVSNPSQLRTERCS
jgi:hypothetical protein